MLSHSPTALQALANERAAEEYLRSLPLEHFMEATPQATQREITLASLSLVEARRDDFRLLLPLPAEMQAELEKTRRQLAEVRQRAEEDRRRADEQ